MATALLIPPVLPVALDLAPDLAREQPGIASYDAFISHPSILSYITRYVIHRTGAISASGAIIRQGWSSLAATDCDDILQDIRITIWRNWSEKFDGRSLNSQIAYAMRVTRSRVLDRYRDRRRRREIVISALDASSAVQDTSESVESDLLSVILNNTSSVAEHAPTLAHSAQRATIDPEALLVERERLSELLGRILSVCATPQHRLILLCYIADYPMAQTLAILATAAYPTTERAVYCTRSRLLRKVRLVLAGESSSRVEQLALLA